MGTSAERVPLRFDALGMSPNELTDLEVFTTFASLLHLLTLCVDWSKKPARRRTKSTRATSATKQREAKKRK